jgi:hypothetical protein
MSAITIDALVKMTISSSPTIRSPMTPAQPLSPGTAEHMVELHQDNPTAILNIAKGLAATIRKREEQYTLGNLSLADKICDLE